MNAIPRLSSPVEILSISGRVEEVGFNDPVYLPFGEIHSRPSIIVSTVVGRDGRSQLGVAEGTSLPMQIPLYDDYSGNLSENVARISEAIVGESLTLREIQDAISKVALGGSFATARMSVEASLLDATARLEGMSVYSVLTGEPDPISLRIPYGKSITEVKEARLVSACHEAVRAGASRLKFKISPGSFDEVYQALIKLMSVYPEADFMVDANGMFDPEDATHLAMLKQLDNIGLLTIEEPVSRVGNIRGLDAHRKLCELYEFNTPITLDDAIKTTTDADAALNEDLANIINLKPGRVGSFLRCIDIAHSAAEKDKQIMVGGMFEASPGRFMTTTLAAYCIRLGFTIPGDLSLPSERLIEDLGTDRLELDTQGNIIYTPKEGWGYDIEKL